MVLSTTILHLAQFWTFTRTERCLALRNIFSTCFSVHGTRIWVTALTAKLFVNKKKCQMSVTRRQYIKYCTCNIFLRFWPFKQHLQNYYIYTKCLNLWVTFLKSFAKWLCSLNFDSKNKKNIFTTFTFTTFTTVFWTKVLKIWKYIFYDKKISIFKMSHADQHLTSILNCF